MSSADAPSLTAAQAEEALREILRRMDEQADLLEECRVAAGSDLELVMQFVVPKLFEIQGVVMMKYGFSGDDDGFAAFAEALQGHEGDPRVRPLSEDLKQRMRSFNPAASQQGGAADEEGDADDAEDGDEDGGEEEDDQDDGDQDDVSEDDADGAAEQ